MSDPEINPYAWAEVSGCDLDLWHRRFVAIVDNIAEERNRLLPFARHLGTNAGLVYPAPEDVDPQYVSQLMTPEGPMDYAVIFERALDNIGEVWTWVARDVLLGEDNLEERLGDWNLDTGRDESGTLVFWQEA